VRQLTKKICLLGDFYVGKTSLVRRFVEGRFDERYLSSIGVKVDRHALPLPAPDGDVVLTLMLWDLASGPEGGPLVPSYYRGAAGAVIVCDLTRPDTVPDVGRCAEGLLALNPGAALVFAANKVDLEQNRAVTDDSLAAMAAKTGAPLFYTSAKTGEQVEMMFRELGRLLIGETRR
jgi:GTPase SAR1 family protein